MPSGPREDFTGGEPESESPSTSLHRPTALPGARALDLFIMYAIISDRNNQATVRVGDEILCDLMGDAERGASITFDNVLMVGGEGETRIGKPMVAGASVVGEIVGLERGSKVVVFRFKRRKNIRVKRGHRQSYTRVRITSINV